MPIDFTSRERLDRAAKFQIMNWDDPVMSETPRGPDGHFVVDGLVPVEVAIEINALFARCAGGRLDVVDHPEIEVGTTRVLIEGLVPFAIAERAQAICNAHNATLAPIDA